MLAISVKQPFASLLVSGRKRFETRSFPTKVRGFLAIHAGLRMETAISMELEKLVVREFGSKWTITLPTGAIVGVVDLVECHPTEELELSDAQRLTGDFTAGRWAWEMHVVKAFDRPRKQQGSLGFFNVRYAAGHFDLHRDASAPLAH